MGGVFQIPRQEGWLKREPRPVRPDLQRDAARTDGYRCYVPGSRELRLRRAGRVIVLDPEGRVLLFRYDDGPPNGRHWSTPGGGLNDGEDYPAGARRELAEETGWTDVPVGPEVYERTQIMEHADAIVRQHERFFLARVDAGERGLGEVADMHVSDGIAGWHWWTLAELDATDEVVWPPGLADLIRRLTG
jgi:ADP-ribose pyrophosphatase YjhB (NUDIX family)